jgi:5-methylcytosine-specific restriction enzyme A
MVQHNFIPGEIYHRRNDIHSIFKGQQYGGIVTPAQAPYVFLFTGDAGEDFGYVDKFQPSNGLYWYTGEGQVGDMQMERGNAAIQNHRENRKSLLLFESAQTAHVRFIGEMAYVGHHQEERPDREQHPRQAIIFHLELLLFQKHEATRALAAQEALPEFGKQRSTLHTLRKKALHALQSSATTAERLVNIRMRSEAVKNYALTRANGVCEGCSMPAPFETKRGPFLEVHHVNRLADGGPDHPSSVIALCPNCHRKSHYARHSSVFNDALKAHLKVIEPQ